MTGIIGAMQIEIDLLKTQMKDIQTQHVGCTDFFTGTIGNAPVVLAKCGIGKVFAAMCAQTMILRFNVDNIINTGVAGSLTAELSVCDMAIASDVLQHDMNTTAVGDPAGMISDINLINIPTDEKKARAAARLAGNMGIKYLVGTIASGDLFVSGQAKKAKIAARFNAICCEMEGGAIGQVCYCNSVPFTAIRFISDSFVGDAKLEFLSFCKLAADKSAKLVCALLNEAD